MWELGCPRASPGALWSPSHLAEQVHTVPHLLVMVPIRRVEKGLALAEGQKPATDEAVVHEAVSALLERRSEINEYVGANDQMEIVERSIGDQAVAGPCDAALGVLIGAGGPARGGGRVGPVFPAA